MSKNVKPKAPTAKRKGKYQMPDPIPNGEILTDLTQKKWKLGTSIGKGGFGEIYSASEVATGKNSFVVKIEPKENGPLFVEMHFFLKVCKSDDIDKWKASKMIKFLGLPQFVGNGSHMCKGKQYRFVVMEKLGDNLDCILKKNKGVLRGDFIFQTALQILDTLEYIHSKGYVHADIKAGNLLFGLNKGTEDKVYVVDFGLASKYSKDFKPDPKCAHNGTIEFTSRDAHVGATTRRGDLEILAYNMLRWFTSRLPWENNISDCIYVQQQKLKYMRDIPGLMETCFGSQSHPISLSKYFNYIADMAPTVAPNYDFIRNLFKEGLKTCGTSIYKRAGSISPVKQAIATKTSVMKNKTPRKKKDSEVDEELKNKYKSPSKATVVLERCTVEEEYGKESLSSTDDLKRGKVEEVFDHDDVSNNEKEEEINAKKLSLRRAKTVNKYNGAVLNSEPSRSLRTTRSCYYNDDFDSDDSDVVYSPPRSTPQKKGNKRKSDETYTPKKKLLR